MLVFATRSACHVLAPAPVLDPWPSSAGSAPDSRERSPETGSGHRTALGPCATRCAEKYRSIETASSRWPSTPLPPTAATASQDSPSAVAAAAAGSSSLAGAGTLLSWASRPAPGAAQSGLFVFSRSNAACCCSRCVPFWPYFLIRIAAFSVGLAPTLEPIRDPLAVENRSGVGLLDQRIVVSQILDDLAVARCANPPHRRERTAMPPPHHLHPNSYCHNFLLRVALNDLSIADFRNECPSACFDGSTGLEDRPIPSSHDHRPGILVAILAFSPAQFLVAQLFQSWLAPSG